MNLNDYYYNKYSQRGEDGILRFIFKTIGVKKGRFVEFGAWDGMYLSNTRHLYEQGWLGLYIESQQDRFDKLLKNYQYDSKVLCLNKHVRERGKTSFDSIIQNYYDYPLDLVSIDVDGMDFYLFRSIQNRPKVFVVEGGKYVPPNYSWLLKRQKAVEYVGQSLKVFNAVAKAKGYSIVCFTQNIIMVRNDYISLFPVSTSLEEIYLQGLRKHSFNDFLHMKRVLQQYQIENPFIEQFFTYKVDHKHFSFKTNFPKSVAQFKNQQYIIGEVDLKKVKARIVKSIKTGKITHRLVPLSQTPHFAYLQGKHMDYLAYLYKFRENVGYGIEHSEAEYQKLTQFIFSYLFNYWNNYIIVQSIPGFISSQYVILDGLHRAALLLYQGINRVPVAIVSGNVTQDSQFNRYFFDYKHTFPEWYTPVQIGPYIIHEKTYPTFKERKEYLTNQERGKSKWDYILKKKLT